MGSEMCIRDRRKVYAHAELRIAVGDVDCVLDRVAVAHQRSMGKRCLLYTSDAADERSSVDLGGRRIIKKKTYMLYQRSRAL